MSTADGNVLGARINFRPRPRKEVAMGGRA